MNSSQVLKRINVLRELWRKQNLSLKPEQQEEWNALWRLRRERVLELTSKN